MERDPKSRSRKAFDIAYARLKHTDLIPSPDSGNKKRILFRHPPAFTALLWRSNCRTLTAYPTSLSS